MRKATKEFNPCSPSSHRLHPANFLIRRWEHHIPSSHLGHPHQSTLILHRAKCHNNLHLNTNRRTSSCKLHLDSILNNSNIRMDNLCNTQVSPTNSSNTRRLITPLHKINKGRQSHNMHISIFLQRRWLPVCPSRTINGMRLHQRRIRTASVEPQTCRSLTTSGRRQYPHIQVRLYLHQRVKCTISISNMYRFRLRASSHNGNKVIIELKVRKVRLRDNSMLLRKDKTCRPQNHCLERTLRLQTFSLSLVHKVSLFRPSTIVRA
jgi:hypothetical protein